MQKIYADSKKLEDCVKQKLNFPSLLMMEHAALAMTNLVREIAEKEKISKNSDVNIFCGKGNNGADGFALARLLQNDFNVTVYCTENPATEEGKIQESFCKKLGVNIQRNYEDFFSTQKNNQKNFIIDCIYGIGFHGKLQENIQLLFAKLNSQKNAIRIACDVPSGLGSENCFNADFTVTMGCTKLKLYGDGAKNHVGKILIADLGISKQEFEMNEPDAYLIEEKDKILPFRKNKSSHKGNYGHSVIFCGEKPGAAILAATASMNFGSGLTSIINFQNKNRAALSQFKISPSLMLSSEIPAKTTCVLAGSGFVSFPKEEIECIEKWLNTANDEKQKSSKLAEENIQKKLKQNASKNRAVVFDAGILNAVEFIPFLENFNRLENVKIVLTPHLSEFLNFINNVKITISGFSYPQEISVKSLAENPEQKLELGKILNKIFPKTTIVVKSANTFIFRENECFIVTDGAQSLSKGGSGDILAGMITSLLAQGYSCKDAAITAVKAHAELSNLAGAESYNLTPEKMLTFIQENL